MFLVVAAITVSVVLTICWSFSQPARTTVVNGATQRRSPPAMILPSDKRPIQRRPSSASDWFRDVTAESHIDFRHISGDSPEKPFPAANGSGLAAIDFDRDGFQDLYFATGTAIPVKVDDRSPTNRMYRNLGAWRFDDVTTKSGLGLKSFSAGIAVGDFDNDGFPDVYVTCYGANCLFRNLGDGTFQEIGLAASVAAERWGTSAAFLDADGDGLLDLYVCNYGIWTPETNLYCGDRQRGIRLFCSPNSIEGGRNILYLNAGDRTFVDASESSGIGTRNLRAQGVVAADLTADGLIDIYVGNDLHPNSLLVNVGGGRFRDVSEASGTAYSALGNTQAGMGVDVADVNRDGRFDLFVTNFQNESNSLYENQGEELFRETSRPRGLAADSIPWVGWGTAFSDFDLDAWVDVVVTNGHVDNNRHLLDQDAPYAQPCLLWKNVRGQFRLVGPVAGDFFSEPHVGRGLVVADMDNDGDQDVMISHQDTPPALLLNQIRDRTAGKRCLVLRLVGTTSNRDGVGSVVTFHSRTRKTVSQITGGGSYLSASEKRMFLAILPEDDQFAVEVRWPDGEQTTLGQLTPDREYVIVQGNPQAQRNQQGLSIPRILEPSK